MLKAEDTKTHTPRVLYLTGHLYRVLDVWPERSHGKSAITQQRITVQYVNVSQGGQTMIGQIEQNPTPTYKTNQLINGLSQKV